MTHDQFKIGEEFTTAGGHRRWRCTDIGTRIIACIPVDVTRDPSWYNGPPYAVLETVMDENDMPDCEPANG